MSPAYYSIIQYMPDYGRREACNVGLVVWHDGHKLVKIQTSGLRLYRFFPTHINRLPWISESILSFGRRLVREDWATLEQMRGFIGRLGNDIVMTEPRSCNPEHMTDEGFSRAFAELVEEPA